MAWIEIHQSLTTNKKTMRLASLLNVETTQAVGYLVFLWLWALDNAQDGDISSMKNSEIALISGRKKKPDNYVESLIESGFLDENRILHDWYDYAGKLILKRNVDTERKRAERAGKIKELQEKSKKRPKDVHRTTEVIPCDGAGTVPNSTEQNTTIPNIPLEIADKFNSFVNMRKKNKKPLTDEGIISALEKLNKLSNGDYNIQNEILDNSIIGSYQGLFALKKDYNSNKIETYEEKDYSDI